MKFLAFLLLFPALALADEVRVAVAANFTAPAKRIAAAFSQATGHRAVLAFGGTGKFYAQVRNGAPFDVLLAADDETPARLEREGHAVPGSRFAYATGRLVLWSARPGFVDVQGGVLKQAPFRHLAVANPRLAPYGRAAMEVLGALGLRDALQPRFVMAENVAQVWQFVRSGNAELGFVALSQVAQDGRLGEGSGWVVPAALHRPIRQEAVLLARGRGKPAAQAWLRFLQESEARALVRAHGYED